MKTFKQFILEALTKKTYREPDRHSTVRRLQTVVFNDSDKVADTRVDVQYSKEKNYPRRAYNVDFSLNHSYHRPNHISGSGRWRDYEKALSHLPSIMRRVKKSIETFASEKKPNQIHIQANDKSKVNLYRTFAHHLAKKHEGHVEEVKDGANIPKFIVHLPGKKSK